MSEYIEPPKREEFNSLQSEAKYLASIGDLKGSLKKFELAKKICATPKVLQRIGKLQECLRLTDRYYSEAQASSNSSSSLSPASNVTDEAPPVLKSAAENTAALGKVLSSSEKTLNEQKVLSDIQNIQSYQRSSEKDSESSGLSPLSQLKFKKLKKEAKIFAYEGQYVEAVKTFKEALCIFDCPNVKRYIKEVESVIASNAETEKLEDATALPGNHHISNSTQEMSKNNSTPSPKNDMEYIAKTPTEDVKKLSSDSESVQKSLSPEGQTEYTSRRETLSSNTESAQKSSVEEEPDDDETEKKLSRVKALYEEARELAADGKLTYALKYLKKAQSVHPTQKVQKRIDKLQDLISEDLMDTEENNNMVEIVSGFSVFHEIYEKLYPYQREGIAWMWKLYKMGKGGVLGDDMGLGKTFQVIAFLSGMIDADLIKHVLIIMPVSLLKNWEKECKKWCPGIAVHDFHSGTKKEKERNLLRVQRRGHVILTSYGMILNNVDTLTQMEGRTFVWDYVILDEGHKIKNPTKTTKAVYEIPARSRLVLTGTPIQNNLRELWSLYDFVHQGTLLGSLKTFKLQYETPITRSREKDATAGEKRLGSEMAENLKALIKPYFLRRTKAEIWKKEDKDVSELEEKMGNMNGSSHGHEYVKINQLTSKKNDLILWTYMSDAQIAIYTDFLHSDAVKSILVSKRSPLVELTTLKKICDHPRLLSQRACFHLGLNGELQKDVELDMDDESALASSIDNVTDEHLLKESGKLKLVITLLENLKENGHRTLVFSLSRKILDMIHRILLNRKWKVMRLDGTIAKTEERERRINKFQGDSSYPVFLLTTQVGGVGLTLTAADRVIIYDPSWNPATDAQAVDRVYRLGQGRDVVVYRLITCGTVEEKIYRRQIFKDSITRQATGVADPYRYFSKQELRELFSLEDPRYSATQVQLHEMHSSQRATYDDLDKHITFLQTLDIFGISDHDLMFSKEIQDHSEDNDHEAISDHFIKQKVAAAHEQIKMEASVVADGLRLAGTFNRPYQETVPLPKKSSAKDTYKPPVLPDIIDLTEDAQDNVFVKNIDNKKSLSPRHDSVTDIEVDSSKRESDEGAPLDQYESPASNINKKDDDLDLAKIRLKRLSHFTSEKTVSSSENVRKSNASEKFEDISESNTFSNIEKFRKSSLVKSPFPDEGNKKEAVEEIDLTVNEDQDVRKVKSIDGDEKEVIAVSKNQDVASTFQANLTHLMNDDIADLSFDETAAPRTVKKGRRSCARRSAIYISESDGSRPNSVSNSRISAITSDEEDSTAFNSDDSSNSASLSFVPDSAPGTPLMAQNSIRNEFLQESVKETPPASSRFGLPELFPKNNSFSLGSPIESGVRRITPLKIDRSLTQENSPFAKAVATSLLITPEQSPQGVDADIVLNATLPVSHDNSDEEGDDDSPHQVTKDENVNARTDVNSPVSLNSDAEEDDDGLHQGENVDVKTNVNLPITHNSEEEDDDSPLKVTKKKQVRQVVSDSDESESDAEGEGHSKVEHISGQRNDHFKSTSSEEEGEQFDADSLDSEDDESASDCSSSEGEDVSDLEQTYATCKEEKAESDSEGELFSDESESLSTESDSIFED